jgi:hypothetical protein
VQYFGAEKFGETIVYNILAPKNFGETIVYNFLAKQLCTKFWRRKILVKQLAFFAQTIANFFAKNDHNIGFR